ncbi:MAG: tripartite tricarboxylate transporter substrate binding protein [Clostridia bacterium]
MKKITALLLAVCLLLALAACATAGKPAESGYPFKTLTMIVPYGAGGTTDLVGRELAKALGKALDVNIVVENQPGASGSIGCRAALDAPKDGSVLLFAADSLGTQRVMGISEMSYADFSPICVVANDPKVIVVAKDSPYQSIGELLDAIEARPNGIQMAYTGPGGSGHVQALIMNRYGYYPALTAYSSGADGIVAVMGGQVVFTNANYSTVANYIAAGELKLLAVCAVERMAQYPEVPALSELMAGSEELLSIPYTPLSLLVAAEVPQVVQDMLRTGCEEAFRDPAFVSFMESNSIDKLYEKYRSVDEIRAFYADWESTVCWLMADAGATVHSPDEFDIPR